MLDEVVYILCHCDDTTNPPEWFADVVGHVGGCLFTSEWFHSAEEARAKAVAWAEKQGYIVENTK